MITPPLERSRIAAKFAGFLPWIFLAGCLAISIHYSRLGWSNPLTGHWRFRETQTAWPVRVFLENGFHIDYETPVLGAPWTIPFEFPTYQICVAALVKISGLPLEEAGRGVTLFFAYGAFALLGVLITRLSGSRAAGICSAALCLVSPVYLYGSRTFVIESTALFFTVAFVLATHEFLTRPRIFTLVLLLIAGAIAGPTKATTYCVGLVGVVGLVARHVQQAWPFRREAMPRWPLSLSFVFAILIPFFLTLAWTHHTDVLKLKNELAAFITSDALRGWNFGTWKQRLDFATWEQLAAWINYAILGTPITWLVGLLIVVAGGVRRDIGFILTAMFASGFLVFTNLYLVHEYYHYATGIYLLALFGVALGALWDRGSFSARLGAGIAAPMLAGLMLWGYLNRNLPDQLHADPALPELAAGIKQATPRGSVIVVYGYEWDSTLSFYAERHAIMERNNLPPEDPRIQRALSRLDRPLGGIVFTSFFHNNWKFILAQLNGLRAGHQRVFTSAAGDVYPAKDAPGVQSSAWQRAGFSDAPGVFESALEVSETNFAGRSAMMVHAPGLMVIDRGTRERHHVKVGFGMREDAHLAATPTDGVTFIVDFMDVEKRSERLFERRLTPLENAADRGAQEVDLPLPDREGVLIFRTDPGPTKSCDWSVWRDVQVH